MFYQDYLNNVQSTNGCFIKVKNSSAISARIFSMIKHVL